MVTQYAENVEFILEQTINFVIAAHFVSYVYKTAGLYFMAFICFDMIKESLIFSVKYSWLHKRKPVSYCINISGNAKGKPG